MSDDTGSSATERSAAETPPATSIPPDSSDDEPGESVQDPPPTTAAATLADPTPEPRFLGGDPEVLFDQDALHTFSIDVAEADLTLLDEDPTAEEYVTGRLTFDGETVERVGVRYKGSIGAFFGCTSGTDPFQPSGEKTCTKLSIKLRIDFDDADDDREFYGQRRIQLHAMNLDASMMRERLGYHLFAEMGVAAPRATHARVEVNGTFVGVFALVEQIDGRFVRDRFSDGQGNLYKEIWPFGPDGETQQENVFLDGLRTNRNDDPDASLIRTFADELQATDPAGIENLLARWTDREALVAHAVVDRAIRHDDGPFHWYCYAEFGCAPHNFYIYEEPDAEKIHVIPWDLDNAFDPSNPVTEIADPWGETRNGCAPFPFGPLRLTQRSAACDPLVAAWASLRDDYERIDAAFRAGPYSSESVGALLDAWTAQIQPTVAEAAASHDDAPSVDQWREAVDRLRTFVSGS